MTITIGSLFSGIGGLDLGLEEALGASVLWQVEQNPFCRRVLAKHWPHAVRYDDVCTARSLPYVDVMCGGFPCQDISVAGLGAGLDGKRSGLWWEYARIIDETKPAAVVIENVAALATRGLARVLGTLADLGYMGRWDMVSAASVGAPHLRRRIFIIATHPERVLVRQQQGWRSGPSGAGAVEPRGDGQARCAVADANSAPREGGRVSGRGDAEQPDAHVDGAQHGRHAADTDGDAGRQGWTIDTAQEPRGRDVDRSPFGAWCGWVPASAVRRIHDGFPNEFHGPRRRRPRADTHRLRALGNAVVPQCAYVTGQRLLEILKANP